MHQMPAKNWVQSRSAGYTSGKVAHSLLRLPVIAGCASFSTGNVWRCVGGSPTPLTC